MRSWVIDIIFLLLMNVWAGVSGSRPPSIPFLTILQQDTELLIHTNQTIRYSPQSFTDLQIICQSEETGEPVNYYWNLVDVPLGKADKEFEIENGTLEFLEPNYGLFECLASNSFGSSYSVIELTKHEDSSAPSLKLVEGPVHLEVPRNSMVRYICTAESTAAVQFTWTWNTQEIRGGEGDWKVNSLTPLKETLERAGVSPEDTGNVGCRVSSGGSTLYQEGSLITITDPALVAMMAPSVRLVGNKELSVLEGDKLSVECEGQGVPEPVLSWTFGTLAADGGVLSIDSVSRNMSGDITCHAANGAGSAEETLALNVFSPSSIIENTQASREFLIGEKLRLECNYEVDKKWAGNFLINWRKNGNSLEKRNISVVSSVGNSLLEVDKVVVEDEGNYTCLLETPLDTLEATWNVKIVSAASILHLDSSKLLLVGTMTVLSCQTSGVPVPDISWLFNEEAVVPDSNLHLLQDGSLQLDSLDLHHAGDYKCVASNQYGQDQKVLSLTVAQPTAPDTGEPGNM